MAGLVRYSKLNGGYTYTPPTRTIFYIKKGDVVVLASEFGRVGKVKYPGVGKKTHYVFEGLFSFPMCISNPNFAKFLKSRGVTVSNWCLGLKKKALSST